MLDIGFYMRFHELIQSLDENKEYTSDEMYEKLEAIRSKDPVVYNIETTNRCNMRCKMCPRTTMMTRANEDISRETFLNVVKQIRPHTEEEWAAWKAFCEKTYGIYEDEKLVSGAFSLFETEKSTVISSVVTDENYRCKGYGENIVKSLLNENQNKDVYVFTENDKIKKWYEKMGFVPCKMWSEIENVL